MSSTRSLLHSTREVAFRARPQVIKRKLVFVQSRFASNEPQKTTPVPSGTKGPNEDQLGHVTEEQADMDKSMGETPPDISQGTPVQEKLSEDPEALKNAPQVIKDEMKGVGQKRSYSTSARRMTTAMQQNTISENGMIRGIEYPHAGPGHKFPLPDVSDLPRLSHLKRRYDPVVEQVTKSLMRDGKLSIAQKNMAHILNVLRTAPPPQPNPAFPGRTLLLSDTSSSVNPTTSVAQAPSPYGSSSSPYDNALSEQDKDNLLPITSLPRSTLPLHPVEYLTTIVDSVSPLVKIRQQKGIAGGGASLPIPVPLGVRQRRRQAIQWILTAADKRNETRLADRVAKELLAIAEGRSGVWEHRAQVHKLGVSARSNVRSGRLNTGRR